MGGKSVGSTSVLRDTHEVSQEMVLPEIKAEIPKLGEELKTKFNDRLGEELTWYKNQVTRLAAKEREGTDHGELKPNLDFKSLAAESSGRLQVLASRTETVWQERLEGLRKEFPTFLLDERRITELVDGARKEGLRDEYLKYAKEKGLSQDEKVRELTKIPEFALREGELRHHLFSDELKETTNRLLEVSYEIGVYTSLSNQGDLDSVAKHRSLQTERATLRETLTRLMSEMPEDYPNRDKIVAGASQINAELGKLELAGMLKFRELSREKQQESLAEYNQKRKEGGALLAVKEIFEKAGDGKEHLMEWCSLVTVGSGHSLVGLVTEGTYDGGASYIQDQRESLNSSSKAGSMWGTDAEFSKVGDISLAVGVTPLGGLRHVSDAVLQPGLELLDVGRIEAQRRAGSLGALAGDAYYGAEDSTKALSYTEYQEAEQSDGMLKTAKKSFEVAEIAASLALGKADTAGKLAGQMVMSGGMGAGSALSSQLMEMDDPNKKFDIARFVDESISNTAGSAVFSSGMRVFRGNNKVLNVVGEGVDKVDGWADFGSSLGNFDNVKGGYSLAGALTGLAVATTDVSDIKIGDKIGEKVDGFIANRTLRQAQGEDPSTSSGHPSTGSGRAGSESEFEFKESGKTVNTLSRVNVATENLIVEGREYEGYRSGNKVFYVANKSEIPELYSSILKSRGEVDPNGSYDVTSFIDKKTGLIFSQMPAPNETEEVTKARSANLAHEDEHREDLEAGREIDEERAYARASKYTDDESLTTYDESRYQDAKNLSLAASRADSTSSPSLKFSRKSLDLRAIELKEVLENVVKNRNLKFLNEFISQNYNLLEIGYLALNGSLNMVSSGMGTLIPIGLPSRDLHSVIIKGSRIIDSEKTDGLSASLELELECTFERNGVIQTKRHFLVYDPSSSKKYLGITFVAKVRQEIEESLREGRLPNFAGLTHDAVEVDLLEISYLKPEGGMNKSAGGKVINLGLPSSGLQSVVIKGSKMMQVNRNEVQQNILEMEVEYEVIKDNKLEKQRHFIVYDPSSEWIYKGLSLRDKFMEELNQSLIENRDSDFLKITHDGLELDWIKIGVMAPDGIINKGISKTRETTSIGLPQVGLESVVVRGSRRVVLEQDKGTRTIVEIELDYAVRKDGVLKHDRYFVLYDPHEKKEFVGFSFGYRVRREIEASLKEGREPDFLALTHDNWDIDLLDIGYFRSNGQLSEVYNELGKALRVGLPGSGLKSVFANKGRILEVHANGVTRKVLELELEYQLAESSEDIWFRHYIVYDPTVEKKYMSRDGIVNYKVHLVRNSIEDAFRAGTSLDFKTLDYDSQRMDLFDIGYISGAGLLKVSANSKSEGVDLSIGLPAQGLESVNIIHSKFIKKDDGKSYLEIGVICRIKGRGEVIRYFGYDGQTYFKIDNDNVNVSPIKGHVLDLLLYRFVTGIDSGAQFGPRFSINAFTGEVREPNIVLSNGDWVHAKWGPKQESCEYFSRFQRAGLALTDMPKVTLLIQKPEVLSNVQEYQEALSGSLAVSHQPVIVRDILSYLSEFHGRTSDRDELLHNIRELDYLSDEELEQLREKILGEITLDHKQYEGTGLLNLSHREAWEAHLDFCLSDPNKLLVDLANLNHSIYWEESYHLHLVVYSAYILGKLRSKQLLSEVEMAIVENLELLYPELRRDSIYSLEMITAAMISAYEKGREEASLDATGRRYKLRAFTISDYLKRSSKGLFSGGTEAVGVSLHRKHAACSIEITDSLASYLVKLSTSIRNEPVIKDISGELSSVVIGRIENYLQEEYGDTFNNAKEKLLGRGSNNLLKINQLAKILKDIGFKKEAKLFNDLWIGRGSDDASVAQLKGSVGLIAWKEGNARTPKLLNSKSSFINYLPTRKAFEDEFVLQERRSAALRNEEFNEEQSRQSARETFAFFNRLNEQVYSLVPETLQVRGEGEDGPERRTRIMQAMAVMHELMHKELEASNPVKNSRMAMRQEIEVWRRCALYLKARGYEFEFKNDGGWSIVQVLSEDEANRLSAERRKIEKARNLPAGSELRLSKVEKQAIRNFVRRAYGEVKPRLGIDGKEVFVRQGAFNLAGMKGSDQLSSSSKATREIRSELNSIFRGLEQVLSSEKFIDLLKVDAGNLHPDRIVLWLDQIKQNYGIENLDTLFQLLDSEIIRFIDQESYNHSPTEANIYTGNTSFEHMCRLIYGGVKGLDLKQGNISLRDIVEQSLIAAVDNEIKERCKLAASQIIDKRSLPSSESEESRTEIKPINMRELYEFGLAYGFDLIDERLTTTWLPYEVCCTAIVYLLRTDIKVLSATEYRQFCNSVNNFLRDSKLIEVIPFEGILLLKSRLRNPNLDIFSLIFNVARYQVERIDEVMAKGPEYLAQAVCNLAPIHQLEVMRELLLMKKIPKIGNALDLDHLMELPLEEVEKLMALPRELYRPQLPAFVDDVINYVLKHSRSYIAKRMNSWVNNISEESRSFASMDDVAAGESFLLANRCRFSYESGGEMHEVSRVAPISRDMVVLFGSGERPFGVLPCLTNVENIEVSERRIELPRYVYYDEDAQERKLDIFISFKDIFYEYMPRMSGEAGFTHRNIELFQSLTECPMDLVEEIGAYIEQASPTLFKTDIDSVFPLMRHTKQHTFTSTTENALFHLSDSANRFFCSLNEALLPTTNIEGKYIPVHKFKNIAHLLPFHLRNTDTIRYCLDMLYDSELRSQLESDLKIKLLSMPFRSQLHFMRFLLESDSSDYERLKSICQRFFTDQLKYQPYAVYSITCQLLVQSFLSYAEGANNARILLDLAEKLDNVQANEIFAAYTLIAKQTNEVSYLFADVEEWLANRGLAALIERRILSRANQILKDLSIRINYSMTYGQDVSDVIAELGNLDSESILWFAAVKEFCNKAKRENAEVDLNELNSMDVHWAVSPSVVPEEIKNQMLAISKANGRQLYRRGDDFYGPDPKLKQKDGSIETGLDYLARYTYESFKASLEDPNCKIYYQTKYGKVITFFITTQIGENRLYVGSVNGRSEIKGMGVGMELFRNAVSKLGEENDLELVCADITPAVSEYLQLGFERFYVEGENYDSFAGPGTAWGRYQRERRPFEGRNNR